MPLKVTYKHAYSEGRNIEYSLREKLFGYWMEEGNYSQFYKSEYDGTINSPDLILPTHMIYSLEWIEEE